MKPNAKDIQRLVFCINIYYDNRKKKSRHSASGHAYVGISDILRKKGGHIRKHLCGERVNQGARTVLGGNPSLKINQVNNITDRIFPEKTHQIDEKNDCSQRWKREIRMLKEDLQRNIWRRWNRSM